MKGSHVFDISGPCEDEPDADSKKKAVPHIVTVADTMADWYHEQDYVTKQMRNPDVVELHKEAEE